MDHMQFFPVSFRDSPAHQVMQAYQRVGRLHGAQGFLRVAVPEAVDIRAAQGNHQGSPGELLAVSCYR